MREYIVAVEYPNHEVSPDWVKFFIPEGIYFNLGDFIAYLRHVIHEPPVEEDFFDFIDELNVRLDGIASKFHITYEIMCSDLCIDAGF